MSTYIILSHCHPYTQFFVDWIWIWGGLGPVLRSRVGLLWLSRKEIEIHLKSYLGKGIIWQNWVRDRRIQMHFGPMC